MNQLVRFACTVSINFIGYTCLNLVHWSNFIHWMSVSAMRSKNRCIESICFTVFTCQVSFVSFFNLALTLHSLCLLLFPLVVDIVRGFCFFPLRRLLLLLLILLFYILFFSVCFEKCLVSHRFTIITHRLNAPIHYAYGRFFFWFLSRLPLIRVHICCVPLDLDT